MGADQIAAIQPAVRELRDSLRGNPSETHDLCLTISVPEHDSAWVQVVSNCVNFGYPRPEEPISFLHHADIPVPSDYSLDGWEPNTFATISGHFATDAELTTFIDRLLIALHDLDPQDYEVDVQFERL